MSKLKMKLTLPTEVQTPSCPVITNSGVLKSIGNTPIIRIKKLGQEFKDVTILAKAEWKNAGGSVKARPALKMIEDGEKSGELTKDKIILDSTSGNTGIAYALIGKVKGYKVKLVMPANVCKERKGLMADFYGAEIVTSSPFEGSDGAIVLAQKIYADNPDLYFMPDQYNNDFNVQAHADTTAPEIWEQTGGQVTHFAATLGTSGTCMGTSRGLKKLNPELQCFGLMPDASLHGLEGLKHMPSSIVPGIYKPDTIDGIIEIETEPSYELTERLAADEGLVVGHSSGGALLGAMEIARKIETGCIVTIFADHGDRYFSENF